MTHRMLPEGRACYLHYYANQFASGESTVTVQTETLRQIRWRRNRHWLCRSEHTSVVIHRQLPSLSMGIQPAQLPLSTGGLPPKIQLNTRPRRKSQIGNGDGEIEHLPLTSEQLAQNSDMIYEQRSFIDHTGNYGLSIFRGYVRKDRDEHPPIYSNFTPETNHSPLTAVTDSEKPLLSPWSWQVYITYGATAEDCDYLPFEFYKSIIEQFSTDSHSYFRFDFLFLPGAGNVACIRHYRGEKRFRNGGELALVPTYGSHKTAWQRNQNWQPLNILIVLDRRDWKAEGVYCLQFDPEDEGKREPGAEVPEGFYEPVRRSTTMEYPYTPGMAWIGEEMESLYVSSRIREEWEKEYLLAKGLMEA